MNRFWRGGELFVWLTASGVAVSLLMVGGMLALIMVHGLGQFWPAPLQEVTLKNRQILIGEAIGQERMPGSVTAEHPEGLRRIRFKVGNRDTFGTDFRWANETDIESRATPGDLVFVERREWGPAYGRVQGLTHREAGDIPIVEDWPQILAHLASATELRHRIERIEREDIGEINQRIEAASLQRRALSSEMAGTPHAETQDRALAGRMAELEHEYQVKTGELEDLHRRADNEHLLLSLSNGKRISIPLSQIVSLMRPNEMNGLDKTKAYLGNLWTFLSGEPREANTEGGIFPAIFGTVLMVFLMTLAVMPFGVMAAIYLREYAKQGVMVRLVRIAVNNLAGVPSIVFGVFGLAFFIYALGGSIDRWLFPESLPNPTFGTGGILWASLTLALLTVPVVIVATEEGLSAVPRDFREGSVGLGATRFETIWHVILPCALPGILTGLILAMARAAGEVAPLMLTGVVKLAPSLPLDDHFPFLHLDRKFMHLGFHIYDVGFQSPNVEAAKPMVYMTTLVLIVVVITLNCVAVVLRNRLRKRYAGSAV
ncbi:MAG: phosphate ABC transporter permease PstA [Nitrospiraceae bacterium]|nr:phosphate ABC transporter permease PstA [Nitrospiraceae bacterium]